MEISDYRAKIDEIDASVVQLFAERMEVSASIAAFKKERGLPVRDPAREEEKIASVRALAPEELRDDTERLFRLLMECSREYQKKLNDDSEGGLA